MKRKILLLGGSGLLGSRINQLLRNSYSIIAPTSTELDLMNITKTCEYIHSKEFDVLVFAAGITNQDYAEENKEVSLCINGTVPSEIARQLKKRRKRMIYFSTDAVFSGEKSKVPYRESDKPSPINYYGFSKLEGEKGVLSVSDKNLVLRVNNLYSSHHEKKIDFARIVMSKLEGNKPVFGITNQFFNPCFVDNIAYSLDKIIRKNIDGILHLGSVDYLSNYEFTLLLCKTAGNKIKVLKMSLEEFSKDKLAKRAHYSWLDVQNATKTLGEVTLGKNESNIIKFVSGYKQGESKS